MLQHQQASSIPVLFASSLPVFMLPAASVGERAAIRSVLGDPAWCSIRSPESRVLSWHLKGHRFTAIYISPGICEFVENQSL